MGDCIRSLLAGILAAVIIGGIGGAAHTGTEMLALAAAAAVYCGLAYWLTSFGGRIITDAPQQNVIPSRGNAMSFHVPREDDCPFCGYLSGAADCAFVARGDLVSAFLNPAQFERGAALVVPNTHVVSLLEVDRHVVAAVYQECQRLARGMVSAFGAVGLNVFQNNGIKAGQTVSHYHVHLVPRYESSQPGRLFRASDYPQTPLVDLLKVADELRRGLPEPA